MDVPRQRCHRPGAWRGQHQARMRSFDQLLALVQQFPAQLLAEAKAHEVDRDVDVGPFCRRGEFMPREVGDLHGLAHTDPASANRIRPSLQVPSVAAVLDSFIGLGAVPKRPKKKWPLCQKDSAIRLSH
jgi:hypothetical protein